MKLITFASFKGGAGKTTALMATCGALTARGLKVGLFEADENTPLTRWRHGARNKNIWDENCDIARATDLAAFEAAYETFETGGMDFALADTQGGGSDLNDTIALSSDLIVLPMTLSKTDLDATLDTYEYIVTLMEENDRTGVPVGILINKSKPINKLAASEAHYLSIVTELPSFDFRLPESNAFKDIASLGMLHLYHDALAAIPAKRIGATHIARAIADSNRLAAGFIVALETKDAAA